MKILANYDTIQIDDAKEDAMVISSTEAQNNFGKYLELSSDHEIIITKNGLPVARLLSTKAVNTFLADSLVGIVPKNVNEERIKSERLARQ